MVNIELTGLLLAIILLVIGIAACFYGCKIFKFLLVVLGFILGAYFTGQISSQFISDNNLLIIAAIAGGIIVGLIVLFFYYTGIFLAGVTIVILISSYLNLDYKNTDHLIILLILCAIGGVLALLFHDFILTIGTAIIGAWFICNSIGYLFCYLKFDIKSLTDYFSFIKSNASAFYVLILFTIILSLLGMIYQFKISHHE